MAYVQPGSLIITPAFPTTQSVLTLSFTLVSEIVDWASIFGFNSMEYVLIRKTGTSQWRELDAWSCNDCINSGLTRDKPVEITIEIDPVDTADTYDIMVIDYGDYNNKSAPYNTMRSAIVKNFQISPYYPEDQPVLKITCVPNSARIIYGGHTIGTGSATLTGDLNQLVEITFENSGYMVETVSHVMSSGVNTMPVQLKPCNTSQVGCYGYTSPPCFADSDCNNGQTCTGGKCISNATGSCTDGDTITNLLCQYKDYIPYAVVGAILLFAMMPSEKKQQPIIIASK
jgi:hypothetical protein